MKVLGIIPARYNSSRLPGKPLIDLFGKPMIQHVVEQAKKSLLLSKIVVATDDARIEKAVNQFGGHVIMTSPDHTSGTSRCAEVVKNLKESFDYVINIQGDEPLIQPSQIDTFSSLFVNKATNIATLARPVNSKEQLASPHVVKVVRGVDGTALYFSRSIIPFNRTETSPIYLQHIGIYGYKINVLQQLVELKESPLELAESLEQLRWLEHGYKINVGLTNDPTFAIDSPDDIEKVKQQMKLYGEAH